MNLLSQSLPSIISNDVDLGVNVDVDIDVADIEKGQEISVLAAAQQAQQQQQHFVTVEEVISPGRTTTTEEDETASCRSMMMMMQQQQENNSSSSICIRISDLSHNLRKSVKELQLDGDGDGQLNTNECLGALQALTTQTKTHSNLKQLIFGLCTFLMLLIVCVTAISITAARLVQDTKIDQTSGIMYVNAGGAHSSSRSSSTIMKTGAVEIYSNSTMVAKMTNDELDILKAILPGNNGDVKFQVKGYARKNGTNNDEEIMVLVEGGTITYDRKGITDATGNAKVLLTFAYGDVFDYSNHDRYSCNDGYISGGPGQQPHL